MSVASTKGLNIWFSKANITPTKVVPTAISSAKPTVVTVAAVAGITAGDAVSFKTTGFPELDGKKFVVGTVDGTAETFEVIGADTTTTTGTLAATPEANVVNRTDMVSLCLSGIDIAAGTANSISIGTFCHPDASLPGNPAAGSVTLSGYVDKDEAGYSELLAAETDGAARELIVDIPSNGYLVAGITVGSVAWTVPLEGSTSFSFSAALSTGMKHRF